MGSSDGEEVTCTVIEGMAYNQMCQAEAGLRGSITDSADAITGEEPLKITC